MQKYRIITASIISLIGFDFVTAHAATRPRGFVDCLEYPTNSNPASPVLADFNRDGNLDLVTGSGFEGDDIGVLLGTGNGGFGPVLIVAISQQPNVVAVADLNHDRRPDIIASGRHGQMCLATGNGDGTFQKRPNIRTGAGITGIATGDFNQDGNTDVALVYANGNRVADVLLGHGDGTFDPIVHNRIGCAATSIVADDVNGDGILDLITSNTECGTVSVLLGNGDGTFQPQRQSEAGETPTFLAAGDFNGDGKLDVVATERTANEFEGTDTIAIILGKGDGTFLAPLVLPTGIVPTGVAVADFNRDGKMDIVASTFYSNDANVWLSNGDGTFQPRVDWGAGRSANGVAVGDLNDDGRVDLVVADFHADTVSVLGGRGDGTFNTRRDFGTGREASGIAVADFNHDGVLDEATSNAGGSGLGSGTTVSVLLGQGGGALGSPVEYDVGETPVGIATADFNQDGNADLVVANQDDDTVSLLLGNGDGTFQEQITAATANAPNAIVVTDANGDGNPDVAVATSGTVSVLLGNGDGTFQPKADIPAGRFPVSVAEGDFDRDGNRDLAVANFNSLELSILLGNGDGTYKPAVNYPTADFPFGCSVADINGDGNEDVVVANTSVGVYLGNGDGTFQDALQFEVPAPLSIAAGDVNGDGFADVATTDGVHASVLRGQGDGSLTPFISYPVGQSTNYWFVGIADLNGDGLPDLTTTNSYYGGSSVSVILNKGD
jgi:hypothetical protein